MRRLMLANWLVAITLTLSGCSGAGENPNYPPNPSSLFAGLASPRELVPHPGRSASARYSVPTSTTLFFGDDYAKHLPAQHVTATLGDQCMLAGGTSSLTYCFYEITDAIATGALFWKLLADMEWDSEVPTAEYGLYFGIPDWSRDAWVWLGPYRDTGTWLATPRGNLPANGDVDLVAVVNYSEVDLFLDKLYLDHLNPDEQLDDAWLYFTHQSANELWGTTSISRIRFGGERELLFAGGAVVSYARPFIGEILGQTRLAYAYREEEHWQIWRAELDGSNPQRLAWRPDESVLPAGWHPAGGAYLYLQGADPEQYDLYVRDTVLKQNELIADPDAPIVDACWYVDGFSDYSAIYVATVSGNWGSSIIKNSANDFPPALNPDAIMESSGGEFYYYDPYSFNVNGYDHPPTVVVFSDCGMIRYYYKAFSTVGADTLNLYVSGRILADPSVSPDCRFLTYVQYEEYEEFGQLYITGFPDPDTESATLLAEDVQGRSAWYDPTP